MTRRKVGAIAAGVAAALSLALTAPAALAGAVLTRDGAVTVGQVSEEPERLAVVIPYGKMYIRKADVRWWTGHPKVTSIYTAGLKALSEGNRETAQTLFEKSVAEEPGNRKAARLRLDAMREPAPESETPAATTAAAANATPPTEAARASSPLVKEIERDLVRLENGRVKRWRDESMGAKPYYLVYFSASWCGPCRQFTPELVKWYGRMKTDHEKDFELVFCSKDRSEDDMEAYMKDEEMPWPALRFAEAVKAKNPLAQYAGRGIPCLVLLDAQGTVLAHSYEDGAYVGPRKAMQVLEERLRAGKP